MPAYSHCRPRAALRLGSLNGGQTLGSKGRRRQWNVSYRRNLTFVVCQDLRPLILRANLSSANEVACGQKTATMKCELFVPVVSFEKLMGPHANSMLHCIASAHSAENIQGVVP